MSVENAEEWTTAFGTMTDMKKSRHLPFAACPCGSAQSYGACCGYWHAGLVAGVHAATPETLMRSRYSAYVMELVDYLLATWHPTTTPQALRLEPCKWLGLEVRRGQMQDDEGLVEFVARCRVGGRAQRLHEVSRFVRHSGRWYYLDGQMIEDA